jgi:endogenous inhibitor of DNA gyrase (YacG/DUF329 family)
VTRADGYHCPACNDWVAPGAPWRPFCSERCKGTDLGHWLAGRYKIPAREDDEDASPIPGETPATHDDDAR